MARRPYVPSGSSDSGALPVVLGATLAAALGAGLVEGLVSRWFSLLLLFPLLLGGIVGGVGSRFVETRRVRHPLVVGVIGLVMGIFSQGIVHLVEYGHARGAIAEAVEKDASAADFIKEHGIDGTVDAALTGEAGGSPFLGYLRLVAKHGITITHAGHSSSSGPSLTGGFAYALWLCEILLAGGLAAWVMAGRAREPFCERCDAWYDTEQVVASGAGDRGRIKATVQRLDGGELVQAAAGLGSSDGKSGGLLVLRGCSRCADHEPVLELRRVTDLHKKPETKKVYSSLVTQAEAQEMRAPRPAPGAQAAS